MGTDIHSIAQVKRDGRWTTVAIGIDGDQRNYNTFAMLANVRNDYGFAGYRTSTGFPVIHEPRGLPEDLKTNEDNGLLINKTDLVCAWDWGGNEIPIDSPDARHLDEEPMYLGDHSFSWCTLTELRTFIENVAKKTETRIVGIVDLAAYNLHKQTCQRYTNWCGMVSGPGIVVESDPPGPRATHVQTSWPVNAAAESRLCEIEAALTLVAERAGVAPEKIRFVYGFDS